MFEDPGINLLRAPACRPRRRSCPRPPLEPAADRAYMGRVNRYVLKPWPESRPLADEPEPIDRGAMTCFLHRYITVAVAIGVGAAAADGFDGVKDHDFDGFPRVVEIISSAPSTGPMFQPSQVFVDNTVVGGEHEVVPPENQHAGELFLDYVRTDLLDQPQPLLTDVLRPFGSMESTLSSQVTDPSSSQVILRDWHARST